MDRREFTIAAGMLLGGISLLGSGIAFSQPFTVIVASGDVAGKGKRDDREWLVDTADKTREQDINDAFVAAVTELSSDTITYSPLTSGQIPPMRNRAEYVNTQAPALYIEFHQAIGTDTYLDIVNDPKEDDRTKDMYLRAMSGFSLHTDPTHAQSLAAAQNIGYALRLARMPYSSFMVKYGPEKIPLASGEFIVGGHASQNAALGIYDRSGDNKIAHLDDIIVPALIVMPGFVGHEPELGKMKSPEYQAQFAHALDDGVRAYLNR